MSSIVKIRPVNKGRKSVSISKKTLSLSTLVVNKLGSRVAIDLYDTLLILSADNNGYKVSTSHVISATAIVRFIKPIVGEITKPLKYELEYDETNNRFYADITNDSKKCRKLYKEYCERIVEK